MIKINGSFVEKKTEMRSCIKHYKEGAVTLRYILFAAARCLHRKWIPSRKPGSNPRTFAKMFHAPATPSFENFWKLVRT